MNLRVPAPLEIPVISLRSEPGKQLVLEDALILAVHFVMPSIVDEQIDVAEAQSRELRFEVAAQGPEVASEHLHTADQLSELLVRAPKQATSGVLDVRDGENTSVIALDYIVQAVAATPCTSRFEDACLDPQLIPAVLPCDWVLRLRVKYAHGAVPRVVCAAPVEALLFLVPTEDAPRRARLPLRSVFVVAQEPVLGGQMHQCGSPAERPG